MSPLRHDADRPLRRLLTREQSLLVYRRGWKDGASGWKQRRSCLIFPEYLLGHCAGTQAKQLADAAARELFQR